jgi:hypothetical protein
MSDDQNDCLEKALINRFGNFSNPITTLKLHFKTFFVAFNIHRVRHLADVNNAYITAGRSSVVEATLAPFNVGRYIFVLVSSISVS